MERRSIIFEARSALSPPEYAHAVFLDSRNSIAAISMTFVKLRRSARAKRCSFLRSAALRRMVVGFPYCLLCIELYFMNAIIFGGFAHVK